MSKLIDLSSNWTLINEEFRISFSNVTIPNSVHSILLANNYIDDPLIGYNDINFRWIVYADGWVLKKVFSINNDETPLPLLVANLVLDSVDTFASIYVNNKLVLSTSNQFVRYESSNLSDLLVVGGENTLEVKFESSVKKALELARQYPYRVPPISPPKVQHGEGQVNMIRKQQCSFSWDWGPAFAPIGINSPVLLRILDEHHPFDVDFSVSVYPTTDNNTKWTLDLALKINQTADSKTNGTLNLQIDEIDYNDSMDFAIDSQNSTTRVKRIIGDLSSSKIKLWWPSGYGEQKLYDLKISVTLPSSKNAVQKSKRIGFRSVELIEDPVDANPDNGLTFYFSVNKQPIFFKGSNWIPADSFQENITPYKLRWLLKSAVLAHMNVLRVWGGGIYEKDEFYDICDELGIMIWQDFMFACGAYPTNKEFLDNVECEVKYQVNRLKHHPSVIVWAGNNENEAAISTSWYNTDVDRQRYLDDYRELYISKIKPLVDLEDPQESRPFLASSPTNGKGSAKENWIAKNPSDIKYGDMHFYDYKMNGWLPESFPIPRLMSEYGVQSMPSYAALEEVYTMPRDADFYGKLNDHREHHEHGLKEIHDEIENNLKTPYSHVSCSSLEPVKKFKTMIYLSQVNQAMHYKTAIELFRRWRDKYDGKTGQGYCMGSMYWQFNDLWHAPTWSTIEYHKRAGKWKMAHYYAKNAYAPLLIHPVLNKPNSSIDIYAISDLAAQSDGRFQLTVHSYESLTPRLVKSIEYSVRAFGSALVHSIELGELERSTGCRIDSPGSSGILTIDDGSSFLLLNNKLADVTNLPIANNLKIESVEAADDKEKGTFSIRLATDQVALFVWLDITTTSFHGIFSKNGFHMLTPQQVVVSFHTDCEQVDADMLKRYLTVQTLANSYA